MSINAMVDGTTYYSIERVTTGGKSIELSESSLSGGILLDYVEKQFTLDSSLKSGSSKQIEHNLGKLPNMVEIIADNGQVPAEKCCSGGYVVVLNNIAPSVSTPNKTKYFATNAGEDTSNKTEVNLGNTRIIGSSPTETYVTLYGLDTCPFVAGITYTLRVYAFK